MGGCLGAKEGKYRKLHREDEKKDNAQPETWNSHAQLGKHKTKVVPEGPALHCREHAQRHGNHDANGYTQQGEDKREGEAFQDKLCHRFPRDHGIAEVQPYDGTEPL